MKSKEALRRRDSLVRAIGQPSEIVRGSLLERTIWHKKGCQTCAKGEGHPALILSINLGQHLPAPSAMSARSTKTSVWIHESFEDARTVVYQPPIESGEGPYTIVPLADYEARANGLARMRIALAGIRLAEVLNRELK